ncbi:MAG: type IV pilus secretin PilQ [Methylococcales bacterium]|nr:type IV pilus secretin PilQ [Methylococcales bacterium]
MLKYTTLICLSVCLTPLCLLASSDEKIHESIASIDSETRNHYTGKRLTLNFQDIPVRQVMAILAEFTGKNIVVSEEVVGNITLKLDNVPWDEVLDFIMVTKELGQYESGNVTLIAPIDKIKNYKEKQQQMEDTLEKSNPLIIEYIKINYAKGETLRNILNGVNLANASSCETDEPQRHHIMGANDTMNTEFREALNDVRNLPFEPTNSFQGNKSYFTAAGRNGLRNYSETTKKSMDELEEKNFLSSRGTVVVDSRTNTLIVKDTANKVDEIKKLVAQLDVPVQQVMIESRIVIADDAFAKSLGVKFGASNQSMIDNNALSIGSRNSKKGSSSANPNLVNDSLIDLGAQSIGSTPIGALGMTLAKGADYVLNLEVQALQSDGRGESISNPRVMTMNRCTAYITQGVQIPYTTALPAGSIAIAQTLFKDATLALNVTPNITPNGSVLMNLVIKKDNVNEAASMELTGNKVLDKREIQSSVLVQDGETIMLGGVYEDSESLTKNKIPFLADLPLVGDFFTNSANKNTKKELLIFVTPKIVPTI